MKNRLTGTSVSPINDFLSHLHSVKSTNEGRWRASCPNHPKDPGRSLAVTTADNGAVLLWCHRGCEVQHIVEAVGMELKDLFPRDEYIQNFRSGSKHRPNLYYVIEKAKPAATLVEAAAATIAGGGVLTDDELAIVRGAASDLRGC